MWNTPVGIRTLSGPEAELIRAGLGILVDDLRDDCFPDDGPEWASQVFTGLSRGQKLALIDIVARALLKADVKAPSPSAIIEATVGAIFETIRTELVCEVERGGDYFFRPLVAACVYDDDFNPASDDPDDWEITLNCIQAGILWDTDWVMSKDFLDAPPELARKLKRQMGIEPNYYTIPAPDPTDDQLPAIINGLDQLLAYA